MTLGAEREDYDGGSLDPADVDPDPIVQFRAWFAHAVQSGVAQPEAMTLATVAPDGRPTSRYVLLRGVDERGFQFFTNYESAKARDLARHPHAALTFGWLAVHRSVRVEGPVRRLPDAESDRYFGGRPRAAQLGAWASSQSAVIADRAQLERALAAAQERFADMQVPRPPHWGGFVLAPERLELWQGRAGRLHDRVRYERDADAGGWRIERLAP